MCIIAAMADDKHEVKMPVAWGTATSGPKKWSATARGDDPTVRVTHAPLRDGIGTGKAFFFVFGFKRAAPRDQEMLKDELAHIDDDIQTLREAGYTVVVDPQATKDEFVELVEGRAVGAEGLVPAGFYWSAHGHADGAVETCDGGTVRPTDLDPAKVHAGLRLAIFGACYVGSRSRTWKAALGGNALVVGWGQPVTIGRAVDFLEHRAETTTDLDDLVARWLLTDAPLPVDHVEDKLPKLATAAGRIGALADRIATVAQMLGAHWHEHDNHLDLEVPLPGDRSQMVRAFLVDASDPFCEGETLFGVESIVGEITALVDPQLLVGDLGRAAFGRVALVASDTDMPCIVTQAFVAFQRATDNDLAAHVYQVALRADQLEDRLFGGDAG
jgi:hypothetical protein